MLRRYLLKMEIIKLAFKTFMFSLIKVCWQQTLFVALFSVSVAIAQKLLCQTPKSSQDTMTPAEEKANLILRDTIVNYRAVVGGSEENRDRIMQNYEKAK